VADILKTIPIPLSVPARSALIPAQDSHRSDGDAADDWHRAIQGVVPSRNWTVPVVLAGSPARWESRSHPTPSADRKGAAFGLPVGPGGAPTMLLGFPEAAPVAVTLTWVSSSSHLDRLPGKARVPVRTLKIGRELTPQILDDCVRRSG
jgi:hypothetical protein